MNKTSTEESPDRPVDRKSTDLLLPILTGVLALAVVPAAIVWIANRFIPSADVPAVAFPEQSFPAHGYTLGEYRKDTDERLHVLGWVDREKRIAHVPIEIGMQLMLAGKSPARDAKPVENPK